MAHPGHQLGRHADDPLTREQQVTFQAAGRVPTVLCRPDPPPAGLAGLRQQAEVTGGGRADGACCAISFAES
jgi:hypothetical protein